MSRSQIPAPVVGDPASSRPLQHSEASRSLHAHRVTQPSRRHTTVRGDVDVETERENARWTSLPRGEVASERPIGSAAASSAIPESRRSTPNNNGRVTSMPVLLAQRTPLDPTP